MSLFRLSRSQPPKERERFYLLPGMGGRARWKKEMKFLRWSIAAGLLASAIVACFLYLISRHP